MIAFQSTQVVIANVFMRLKDDNTERAQLKAIKCTFSHHFPSVFLFIFILRG